MSHFTKVFHRGIVLLVLVAMLAVYLPQPALAATPAKTSCSERYTVKLGDTLSSIATAFKVKLADLIEANNLKEPYIIYVGQKLCIPKVEKPANSGTSDKSGNTKAVNFSVTYIGDVVTLSGSGFSKGETFKVKADNAKVEGTKWYVLGTLKTRSSTSFKVAFTLPKDLKGASMLTVCIKNQVTDVLACKTAFKAGY
jgi:LysM repeat protein